MIVFDLRCASGHVFEAWFASGAAYDTQAASDQVRCPLCDSADVAKAAMAPAVPAKGNRAAPLAPPERAKHALRALAAAQAEALKGSEWVGPAFARKARAMHDGQEDHRPIHGQATLADAKALVDEGVTVAPLPLPVAPPETLN